MANHKDHNANGAASNPPSSGVGGFDLLKRATQAMMVSHSTSRYGVILYCHYLFTFV
ncbi:hypothetical protein ACRALDRAFT_2032471 [Sodiomyces alcalophilus JCM 7366]|uniref:uncharacterized protein n=1 Tax=Sodiomyces alcalophilus JCM 7366 TaxID=591952 RepID=UPI0039B54ACB